MQLSQVKTDADADRYIDDVCDRARRVGVLLYEQLGINHGLAEDAAVTMLMSGESLDKVGDQELAELVAHERGWQR